MPTTPSTLEIAPEPRAQRGFPWRVSGVLLLAAFLGSLALLPYPVTLLEPALASSGPTTDLVIHGVVPALLGGS